MPQLDKVSKYEIELEKNEPVEVDESAALLKKLKEIDLKFNEIQEKLNILKDTIKKKLMKNLKRT